MEKPYLIKIHNSEEEYKALKVNFDIQKPLAFLDEITVGLTKSGDGKLASNITSFDITPQLEFSLIDDSVIDKMKTALIDFGFEITIIDATEDLLHNKIDLTNASEFTRHCINKFYIKTFDSDDILDKINYLKIGFESLTELDKSIINKKTLRI